MFPADGRVAAADIRGGWSPLGGLNEIGTRTSDIGAGGSRAAYTFEVRKDFPPFVLVGHSLGALDVRLFTQHFGNDVVGVVLVDPADESSLLFNMKPKRWMKLWEQATGRTIPAPRRTGPGYKPEEDYLGDEAQLLYLERQTNPTPFA